MALYDVRDVPDTQLPDDQENVAEGLLERLDSQRLKVGITKAIVSTKIVFLTNLWLLVYSCFGASLLGTSLGLSPCRGAKHRSTKTVVGQRPKVH